MTDENMPIRWRLLLGDFADESLPTLGDDHNGIDGALHFLYNREYGSDRGVREDGGGREASALTVPAWIVRVRKLFPRCAVEIMQKEALEKYRLTELLTDPEILRTMEPNLDLLKNILAFKNIIPDRVKALAYEIVAQAVREIQKKLEIRVRRAFTGKKMPSSGNALRIRHNFDFHRTVRKNLKNYSAEYNTIVADRLYFHPNVKRYNPWNVIILVDESGSMLDSVIHSAVMAGIFARLPFLAVQLVLFDTTLVDVSNDFADPVCVLMKVQLGGGTDIHSALEYARKIMSAPQKTIVVLVSDLYDGKEYRHMYQSCRDIVGAGARLFVLTSLDYEAQGVYDKNAAKHLAGLGAKVAALTPEALAEWIGGAIA